MGPITDLLYVILSIIVAAMVIGGLMFWRVVRELRVIREELESLRLTVVRQETPTLLLEPIRRR